MQLNEFQEQFYQQLLDRNPQLDPAFASYFKAGRIPLTARLSVYRENVMEGLSTILSSNFPAVTALVGQDFMGQLALCYLRQNPPQTANMDLYGDGFAEFIEAFPQTKSLPYLADIARLDRAVCEVAHAADDIPLRRENLSSLLSITDFDHKTLPLRGCIRIMHSSFPAIEIRQYALREDPTPSQAPDISSGGEHIIIYRPDLRARAERISPDEAHLLSLLRDQKPLSAALQENLRYFPNFSFERFLQKNLARETFLAPPETEK